MKFLSFFILTFWLSGSMSGQIQTLFYNDFSNDLFGSDLTPRPNLEGGLNGQVVIADGVGLDGGKGVLIGKTADGNDNTLNGLDLHLNLKNRSHVYLSFFIRDFYEENHDKDGLFFSNDDGLNFTQVYTFKAQDWCDDTWGEFPPFHINQLAESVGMELTDDFVIRIQQYDNADFNTYLDEDGLIIDNLHAYIRTPKYSDLPFEDDFQESTMVLGNEWRWSHADQTVAPLVYKTKPTGFVGILEGWGLDNSKGVLLGKRCDDGYTANALDLHLDLKGKSNVYLSFWIRDFYEEGHPEDGLFFSNDGGATFHQVYTFYSQDWCNDAWGQFPPFHVDALAEAAGLAYTDQFIIRFQQYDDADFNTYQDEDGLILDNVKVYERPPVYTGLPFEDDFENSTLELGESWSWSHADLTITPLEKTVKPSGFVGIAEGWGTDDSRGLLMGKRCDDGYTSNALDLHLNLEEESNVFLEFDIRDFYEENHDEDGLYFSNDGGATFHQVYTFRAQDWCDDTWGKFPPFFIDSLAEKANLTLTDKFIIRFQQYDDADFNTYQDEDGFILDNVHVYTRPPHYASLPFEDDFEDSSLKFLDSWQWSHADETVLPLINTVKPTGFVGIVENTGVNSSRGAVLGKICDDGFTSNALDLHLNLAGESDVTVCFSLLDFYNENHEEDGLYFSNDGGAHFTKIYSFDFEAMPDNEFIEDITLSLDDLLTNTGLAYTSTCILRFQQYDDADYNTYQDEDGYIIDNVNVKGMMTSVSSRLIAKKPLSFYPNPATDHVYLKSEVYSSYQIFSTEGVLLKSGVFLNALEKIEIHDLPKGTLLLQVKNDREINSALIIRH